MKKNILNNKNCCRLACWLVIAWLVTSPAGFAQSSPFYPSAKHGGNYMHNYYFPPAPSTTKPATPTETKPEVEPAPMTLPFTLFTMEMNIAKFFLRAACRDDVLRGRTCLRSDRLQSH